MNCLKLSLISKLECIKIAILILLYLSSTRSLVALILPQITRLKRPKINIFHSSYISTLKKDQISRVLLKKAEKNRKCKITSLSISLAYE